MHIWHSVRLECTIEEDDPLVEETTTYLRNAYGEDSITGEAASSVEEQFDMKRIQEALRKGYPNSEEEGDKPDHLKNFRSETAELLAKKLLEEIVGVQFPVHAQATKGNPNQPVLGFDGAGFIQIDSEYFLALMEVKGTEDSPSSVADTLASECLDVPESEGKLSSALSMLATRLEGTEFHPITLRLLEKLGGGGIEMVLAPVVVKGTSEPSIDDLDPIVEVIDGIEPHKARGMSVALGVSLSEFAEFVTAQARTSN
jgi:hypothetical protein